MKPPWPLLQRLFATSAVVLGLLGVLACVAAGMVTWKVGSRLERANAIVFQMLDTALASAQQRVEQVQQHAQQSKITAEEIKQRVEAWAQSETRERLAARLKLGERAAKLSAELQQADELLSASTESVRLARRALELGSTMGVSWEPASLDPLIDRLTALQGKLREAATIVEQVRGFSDEGTDGDARRVSMQRILQWTARIVATFTEIDRRLVDLTERLSQLRGETARLKSRLHRYILAGEIVITLLLIWMACGQALLCRFGWMRGRRNPSNSGSSPLI